MQTQGTPVGRVRRRLAQQRALVLAVVAVLVVGGAATLLIYNTGAPGVAASTTSATPNSASPVTALPSPSASGLPSTGPSDSTSTPTETARPTAAVSDCAGSDDDRWFWARAARELGGMTLYCPPFGADWLGVEGSAKLASGRMSISYVEPDGARLDIREGDVCTVDVEACLGIGSLTTTGNVPLADMTGTMVKGSSGAYAVYSNQPTEAPKWIVVASGLSQRELETMAAGFVIPPSYASPPPQLGKPKYPDGPKLVPVLSNETVGQALLVIHDVSRGDVPIGLTQTSGFPIVCAWTSQSSVRPAFLQRVKVLGANLELFWSVGTGWDGVLGANVSLTHGLLVAQVPGPGRSWPGQSWVVGPGRSLEYPEHASEITRTRGTATGSIDTRLDLYADSTTVGDVQADVSISWDCGSAPSGVTGTFRPDPTGETYDALYNSYTADDPMWAPPQASSGGQTIDLDPGWACPWPAAPAYGDPGDIMCTEGVREPVPSSAPLVVAAGSTIEISAPGRWLPWPEAMEVRGASTNNLMPVLPDGYRFVYEAPAPGTYDCYVVVDWIDDMGWTRGGIYMFKLQVK